MGDPETRNIAAIALNCRSSITNLLAATTGEGCCVKDFLNTRDIQQMRDRFNQWAGNLGALHPFGSPLSIEHRLRDAPWVKESILHSLSDLYSSIQAAIDIALGRRPNRVTKLPVVISDADLEEYDLYPSESDSSSVSSSSSDIAPDHTSEIQELLSAIRISINSLFKASIFIRSSASRQRRLRAAGRDTFDNSADIVHVKDRYPLLKDNPTLSFRLGEANARRRQFFKYVDDHNKRLAAEPTQDELDNVKAQDHPDVVRSETALTILTGETKPSLVADTAATTFVADEAAQARMLEMPAAQEANSVKSFATSIAETLDEDLPFPPVPAEAENGSSFRCPYCCIYQELKHEGVENEWRKHVLKDLEPYICTFSSCSLDTFQSQRAWFEHELLVHRSQWICPECSIKFRSSDGLKGHVSQNHRGLISKQQLPAFIEQSKRPVDSIQPSECPFCDDPWAQADASVPSNEEGLVVSPDQFRQHLGKHLQQVALFSLPRLSTEDQKKSFGPINEGEVPDQDALSEGWNNRGHGRRWTIFFALASFLSLYRAQRKYEGPYTLHFASKKGNEEIAQLLLDQGADVNAQDETYGTPLQIASKMGHENLVRLLLNQGADVNLEVPMTFYNNALQTAACEGHEKIIQLLLDRGANISVQHKSYGTLLQIASYHGHESTVQLLLNQGMDVNFEFQTISYSTALQAAACGGHEKIIQLLLDHGANIHVQQKFHGTLLQIAAYFGHRKAVQILLDHGMDVNFELRTKSYANALQAAACGGHEEVVQLLLDYGADTTMIDKQWGSILQTAAYYGRDRAFQLLLKNGVNVNAGRGILTGGPLHAAAYGGSDKVVQILLDHGLDIDAQDDPMGTPLHRAAYNGKEKVVQLLLDQGADIHTQDGYGDTPLHRAAYNGKEEVIQLLLDQGADINAPHKRWGDALQIASYEGREEAVQVLIDRGANVNNQAGEYGNAFQAASSKGYRNIMQRLLDSGADEKAHGAGYAFITVTVLGMDRNLLLRLSDSVRKLKHRLLFDSSSMFKELKLYDTESVRLVLDNKTLEDVYQQCSEAGLKEGSHVFCHLEKYPTTDVEARTQAVSAVPPSGPSPSTVSE